METKKLSNWKRTLAGLVVGATSLIAGCGSDNKLVGTPGAYLQTTTATDYVSRHGGRVPGQVRQDLVSANVNDRLSGFMWQNYSHKENAVNERDFGLVYSFPITKEISAKISPQLWDYPTGTFGSYDVALEAGLGYKEPKTDLKFDLSMTHLFKHDETPEGTRLHLKASRDFSVYEDKKNNFSISLTPSLGTACIENYYGKSGNFTQFTPGINLGLKKKLGKADLGLNLFVNQQFGNMEGIETFTWGGISLSVGF